MFWLWYVLPELIVHEIMTTDVKFNCCIFSDHFMTEELGMGAEKWDPTYLG